MSRIIGWPSASQKMPAQAAMQFNRQSAVKSGAEMKASVSNAVAGKNLEYDHIIPVAEGGSNTARNIELLCQDCNRAKSDLIQ